MTTDLHEMTTPPPSPLNTNASLVLRCSTVHVVLRVAVGIL